MAQTKTQLRSVGDILAKKGQEFTFQDPALVSAPNSVITDMTGSVRKIPDLSKTLAPALGRERIIFKELFRRTDEKGPNGEIVYEMNQDPRCRAYGLWERFSNNDGVKLRVGNGGSTPAVLEFTFRGTGLNLVYLTTPETVFNVFVDGVSAGSVNLSAASSILNGRIYTPNVVGTVVKGLAEGIHTVRLVSTASNPQNINVSGVEFLMETSTIRVPQGEVFSGGNKFNNQTLSGLAYNSGFDGSPSLNGRGGHVVEYLSKEGILGKVIQQTNGAAAYHSNADHTNEEIVRKINFREFGVGRSDDFSTLNTASTDTRAFALEDNNTFLWGSNNQITAGFEGAGPSTSPGALCFTFIGTGLDIEISASDNSAYNCNYAFHIDGTQVVPSTPGSTLWGRANRYGIKVIKVASGLPYGVHTFKLSMESAGVGEVIRNFFVYAPKKPAIPAGAIELQRYYLMATFVNNYISGNAESNATGTIRHGSSREIQYIGAGWQSGIGPFVNTVANGQRAITSATAGNSIRFTFWGTGFVIQNNSASGDTASASLTINGLAATAANFPGVTFTASPGFSYNSGAGSMSMINAVATNNTLVVNGLPLGVHTITLTNNNAQVMQIHNLDVIAPVHFPSEFGGNSLGPAPKLSRMTSASGVDMGKAKAWVRYDATNGRIEQSENIAAVVRISAGRYFVFFERPFADRNYAGLGTNTFTGGSAISVGNSQGGNPGNNEPGMTEIRVWDSTGTLNDPSFWDAAFFGKLRGEEESE